MAQATLAGIPFRVNPLSASWDYVVKTSKTDTIGGKVIQVLGVEVTDMVISGTFGSEHVDPATGRLVGGWREQEAFLVRMKYLGAAQVAGSAPVRFMFPSKGWDFLVKLRSYTEVGQGEAVVAENDNFAPTWQLTLFIVEDNSPIRTVQDAALLQYMTRLSAGLGWSSKWHGPMTQSDVDQYVTEHGANSVLDLVASLEDE